VKSKQPSTSFIYSLINLYLTNLLPQLYDLEEHYDVPLSLTANCGRERRGNVLEVAMDAGYVIPHLCFSEAVKALRRLPSLLCGSGAERKVEMTTSCTILPWKGLSVLHKRRGVCVPANDHRNLSWRCALATSSFRIWPGRWESDWGRI